MGANQSGDARASSTSEANQSGGILVVNPTPSQQKSESIVNLPKRVPPVLSLEVDEFAKSRSELTATRQAQLQDKIAQVDEHVQKFTESYVNGKHKALSRMNNDCLKMNDINKLLEKCTIQSHLCVNMLNKLNFLLPDDQKLESLEP